MTVSPRRRSSSKHDAKLSGRAEFAVQIMAISLLRREKANFTRVEFENFFNLTKSDEYESSYETCHDVTRVLENIEENCKARRHF